MGASEFHNSFPLFSAPPSTAAGYAGAGPCSICQEDRFHRYELGVGTTLIVACPNCGTGNGIREDAKATLCERCRTPVRPGLNGDHDVACDVCIRAGRVAFTHDTEFGMVRWEDAMRGVTHGRPGLTPKKLGTNHFHLKPPNADGWVSAVIPSDVLLDLTRTPSYPTIQGESWMFHCSRPMVYVGSRGAADFDREANGNGEALFLQTVEKAYPEVLGWVPDVVSIYMFRCATCGLLRGHWDAD